MTKKRPRTAHARLGSGETNSKLVNELAHVDSLFAATQSTLNRVIAQEKAVLHHALAAEERLELERRAIEEGRISEGLFKKSFLEADQRVIARQKARAIAAQVEARIQAKELVTVEVAVDEPEPEPEGKRVARKLKDHKASKAPELHFANVPLFTEEQKAFLGSATDKLKKNLFVLMGEFTDLRIDWKRRQNYEVAEDVKHRQEAEVEDRLERYLSSIGASLEGGRFELDHLLGVEDDAYIAQLKLTIEELHLELESAKDEINKLESAVRSRTEAMAFHREEYVREVSTLRQQVFEGLKNPELLLGLWKGWKLKGSDEGDVALSFTQAHGIDVNYPMFSSPASNHCADRSAVAELPTPFLVVSPSNMSSPSERTMPRQMTQAISTRTMSAAASFTSQPGLSLEPAGASIKMAEIRRLQIRGTILQKRLHNAELAREHERDVLLRKIARLQGFVDENNVSAEQKKRFLENELRLDRIMCAQQAKLDTLNNLQDKEGTEVPDDLGVSLVSVETELDNSALLTRGFPGAEDVAVMKERYELTIAELQEEMEETKEACRRKISAVVRCGEDDLVRERELRIRELDAELAAAQMDAAAAVEELSKCEQDVKKLRKQAREARQKRRQRRESFSMPATVTTVVQPPTPEDTSQSTPPTPKTADDDEALVLERIQMHYEDHLANVDRQIVSALSDEYDPLASCIRRADSPLAVTISALRRSESKKTELLHLAQEQLAKQDKTWRADVRTLNTKVRTAAEDVQRRRAAEERLQTEVALLQKHIESVKMETTHAREERDRAFDVLKHYGHSQVVEDIRNLVAGGFQQSLHMSQEDHVRLEKLQTERMTHEIVAIDVQEVAIMKDAWTEMEDVSIVDVGTITVALRGVDVEIQTTETMESRKASDELDALFNSDLDTSLNMSSSLTPTSSFKRRGRRKKRAGSSNGPSLSSPTRLARSHEPIVADNSVTLAVDVNDERPETARSRRSTRSTRSIRSTKTTPSKTPRSLRLSAENDIVQLKSQVTSATKEATKWKGHAAAARQKLKALQNEHAELQEKLKVKTVAETQQLFDNFMKKQIAHQRIGDAPTEEVSLVFTDIQGSTTLWETFPEQMPIALELHNQLCRDMIKVHEGYEVKTEGDAFMVAFDSPRKALDWCCSVQKGLLKLDYPPQILGHSQTTEEWHVDEGGKNRLLFRGLRVRMGIHTGRPIVKYDATTQRIDYFGRFVNRAARVSGKAIGGEIVLTRTTFDLLQDVITTHSHAFEMTPLGMHQYKGVDESIEIFRILPRELARRRYPSVENTVSSNIEAMEVELGEIHSELVAAEEARERLIKERIHETMVQAQSHMKIELLQKQVKRDKLRKEEAELALHALQRQRTEDKRISSSLVRALRSQNQSRRQTMAPQRSTSSTDMKEDRRRMSETLLPPTHAASSPVFHLTQASELDSMEQLSEAPMSEVPEVKTSCTIEQHRGMFRQTVELRARNGELQARVKVLENKLEQELVRRRRLSSMSSNESDAQSTSRGDSHTSTYRSVIHNKERQTPGAKCPSCGGTPGGTEGTSPPALPPSPRTLALSAIVEEDGSETQSSQVARGCIPGAKEVRGSAPAPVHTLELSVPTMALLPAFSPQRHLASPDKPERRAPTTAPLPYNARATSIKARPKTSLGRGHLPRPPVFHSAEEGARADAPWSLRPRTASGSPGVDQRMRKHRSEPRLHGKRLQRVFSPTRIRSADVGGVEVRQITIGDEGVGGSPAPVALPSGRPNSQGSSRIRSPDNRHPRKYVNDSSMSVLPAPSNTPAHPRDRGMSEDTSGSTWDLAGPLALESCGVMWET